MTLMEFPEGDILTMQPPLLLPLTTYHKAIQSSPSLTFTTDTVPRLASRHMARKLQQLIIRQEVTIRHSSKLPQPIAGNTGAVWGLEPKLLKLENGLIVLSTGRGGLMLWAAQDPPTLWVPFNLATHHNSQIGKNSSYVYTNPYPLVSRGTGQTTSYTGMTAVGKDGVLILLSYDYFNESLGHHHAIFTVQVNVSKLVANATREPILKTDDGMSVDVTTDVTVDIRIRGMFISLNYIYVCDVSYRKGVVYK
jgi:hypothetical protein